VAREELSGPDYPDGYAREGFVGGDERMAPPRDVSAECSEDEVNFPTGPTIAALIGDGTLPKRKRIRVRSPKLYACDVEVGAVYVPKLGNDKTPNVVVSAVSFDDDEMVNSVWYHRSNESVFNAVHAPVEDFLAIVARKVEA
jgi:hypothetical protein